MSDTTVTTPVSELDARTASVSLRAARRGAAGILRQPTLVLAILYILFVLLCVFAPQLVAAHDPISGEVADRLLPPGVEHPFGTDPTGRDMLARVVYGASNSLQSIVIAVGSGFVVGSLVGLLSGFIGGWFDEVLMRLVDILLAVPSLLLSLALIAIMGPGLVNVALAVGVAGIPSFARLLRADVMKVRGAGYVEAARAGGARWYSILFRHVLPNSSGVIVSMLALEFGNAVLAVSALSFLGYGAAPPTPEWGRLVAEGRDYLTTAWWLVTIPGLAVSALVLASNRIAQATERKGAR